MNKECLSTHLSLSFSGSETNLCLRENIYNKQSKFKFYGFNNQDKKCTKNFKNSTKNF